MRLRRQLFFATLLCVCSLGVHAQNTVSGDVNDTDGKPMERVVVRLLLETRTLSYTMTDSLGHYSLKLSDTAKDKALTLSFSSLGYEAQERQLPDSAGNMVQDVTLKPDPQMMKELKVYAPPVRHTGDTLTYDLAQFLGKGDVTLEDGLRRLPGIEIANDGTISYLGRDIDHFYIEGLDMLGGRYNLATRNLHTDHVTQVEVLRHHRDKKIERDEESDNVAMNVKLSKKAKFRPIGQPTIGLGIREKDALYAAGVTGMMFTDRFQTICTGKYGNFGDYASYDLIDHFGGSGLTTYSQSKFPAFGAGAPPLGEYRYQKNGSASLNGIVKLDSLKTMKANLNYTYEDYNYSSSNSTTYFAGGEGVTVSESMRPTATLHKPSVDVNYRNDTERKYVDNNLKFSAQFETDGNPVHESTSGVERDISQSRKVRSFSLADNTYVLMRVGKHKLRISAENSFVRTPSLDMQFSIPIDNAENGMSLINQQSQCTSFRTKESTGFTFQLPRRWRFNIPVSFEGVYDFIETLLLPDLSENNIHGWRLSPSASPSLDWKTNDERLSIMFGVALRWLSVCYYPKHEDNVHLHRFYSEPSLRVRYTLTPYSELQLTSAYNNNVGDVLSLLTHDMQTDYRSTSAASGVIATQKSWNTLLSHKLELPMQFFTLLASAQWSQSWSNVLNSQYVSGADVTSGTIFADSHSRNATLRLSATKNIMSLRTKINVGGAYNWGSSQSMEQNERMTTYSNSVSANGGITINPISWMEVSYNLNYGFSKMRYLGVKQHNQSFDHRGRLAFFPIKAIELAASYDHIRQQLTEGTFKNFELFDASAQWKHKKFTLKLAINNLLNTHHIAWTVLDGVNSYSYNYNLCGRAATLTLALTL